MCVCVCVIPTQHTCSAILLAYSKWIPRQIVTSLMPRPHLSGVSGLRMRQNSLSHERVGPGHETRSTASLVPRPHPLPRRNGLVNQVEFLGLAHTFATL